MRRVFLLFVLAFLVISFSLVSSFAEKLYTSEDFKNIFLKEVKNRLFWVKGDLYVEKIRIEPELVIIPKSVPYRVNFITTPKIGSNLILLEFKEGESIKRVKIWGYVDAKVPVVVLKRNLSNKTILSEKDLALELKPLSRLPQDAVLDKNSVLGKELRMSLKAGTVLRYSHIQRPVIIKRNQVIYIVARGRNFVVKAKGIALQDGREGGRIKVRNISSKKILWGKVVSPEEVEVIL